MAGSFSWPSTQFINLLKENRIGIRSLAVEFSDSAQAVLWSFGWAWRMAARRAIPRGLQYPGAHHSIRLRHRLSWRGRRDSCIRTNRTRHGHPARNEPIGGATVRAYTRRGARLTSHVARSRLTGGLRWPPFFKTRQRVLAPPEERAL